ncbi:MAG: MBL fold metallo-hydrolase [Erysipelotrichia bacterium]|nr:MBL fold metallo-hydrolase [Erysipelotrichia bacterium]
MKITTLIENGIGCHKELDCEHGLSLLIEVQGKRILFDTGQTEAAIDNAKKLNVNLKDIDYLILSHGHYDHTGGVKRLVKEFDCQINSVLVGKGFFCEKYKTAGEELVFIGNSFTKELFSENNMPILEVDEPKEIESGVWLFRGFEQKCKFEAMNVKFLLKDNDNFIQDYFTDEVSLAIDTSKGLVVIVGCSHPGIVNILTTIKKALDKPIYAVIGGSHLVDADEKRIEQTIVELDNLNIKKFYLSHCTGELATNILKEKYGEDYISNHTGDEIIIL